jgi:hypothetical protein
MSRAKQAQLIAQCRAKQARLGSPSLGGFSSDLRLAVRPPFSLSAVQGPLGGARVNSDMHPLVVAALAGLVVLIILAWHPELVGLLILPHSN